MFAIFSPGDNYNISHTDATKPQASPQAVGCPPYSLLLLEVNSSESSWLWVWHLDISTLWAGSWARNSRHSLFVTRPLSLRRAESSDSVFLGISVPLPVRGRTSDAKLWGEKKLRNRNNMEVVSTLNNISASAVAELLTKSLVSQNDGSDIRQYCDILSGIGLIQNVAERTFDKLSQVHWSQVY